MRLARQHLFESLTLAVSAGALGMAIALMGLAAVHRFRPDDLAMLDRAAIDPTVALFGFALALGAGLLFGILPALQTGSGVALGLLGNGRRGGRDDRVAHRARWGLVVGETALSFALLVTSALLVRTMISFQQVDVGFEPEGLVVAEVGLPDWEYPEPADQEATWRRVIDGLGAMASVVSVERASGMPTRPGVYFGELALEDGATPEGAGEGPFFGHAVGPSYFQTLRQPVLSGRGFTEDEVRTEAEVYVLSASTARALWPEGDAVGRRMRLGDTWHTVVGVVADVPATGLADEESRGRQLYTPITPSARGLLMIRVEGGARTAIPLLAERLRALAPDAPIELYDAATVMGESVAVQRFVARLLSFLAVLALVLAAVGLYGVMAQTVGRRKREIGIRMSLGARAGEVAWMVLKNGAGAAVVGIGAGAILALAGGRVVESQLFGVAAADPLAFVSAGVVLLIAVLLAAWMPARHAASIDPVRAIASD